MKKFTFLKMMLVAAVMFAGNLNVFAQYYILQDDFSTITSGDNTTTSGSGTSWTGDVNFPTVSSAYQADGAVKLGSKSASGSITSKTLDLSVNGGGFSVSFDVKGWTTVEGSITVTVTGLTPQTVTYTQVMSGTSFENKVLNFTGGTAGSTVIIATTAKRAFIDNVNVYYATGTPSAAPVFTPAAGTYSAAQSVTISNGSATDKIYYTTDGTAPTSASTLYTGAINVAATTTVKAIAYDSSNANPSAVITALYTINIPTITVTETSIPEMAAEVGGTDTKTIMVSGIDLTANVDLAITGTDAGMFSVSPNTLAPVSGVVANTIVIVTYAPTVVGNHSANLEVSSPGAQTKTMPLTGVATVATGVISNHLDANAWAANGNVMFNATAGERVEIFNSLGQKVVSSIAVEGLNKVSVAQTGMLIVKVSNRMSKVLL